MHVPQRMAEAPDLMPAVGAPDDVTVSNRRQQIETHPVVAAADKGDVLGMGPAQWHGRTRGAARAQVLTRRGVIPELFADHAAIIGKLFHRLDIGHGVTSCCEFVVAALTGEDGPGAAHAAAVERAAIRLLPVAIVVVPSPAGPLGQVALDDAVDDFQ